MSEPQYFHQFLNSCSLPCVSGSSGVGQDVSRSPHGVGMNDFDLLKVLGTGGDCQPIYCLLLYFYGFGESYSGLFCSYIQSIVTYICSVWESLPCEEDPWARPWPPLCHEGSSTHHYDHHDYHHNHHCVMKIRKNIIFLVQDSYFPTGVEEGEHRAEEEDNRAHKDRAPGIPT